MVNKPLFIPQILQQVQDFCLHLWIIEKPIKKSLFPKTTGNATIMTVPCVFKFDHNNNLCAHFVLSILKVGFLPLLDWTRHFVALAAYSVLWLAIAPSLLWVLFLVQHPLGEICQVYLVGTVYSRISLFEKEDGHYAYLRVGGILHL